MVADVGPTVVGGFTLGRTAPLFTDPVPVVVHLLGHSDDPSQDAGRVGVGGEKALGFRLP